MNIREIYSTLKIPPNLQQHMLRVAGVCKLILDQIDDENIHKEDILTAALLHDAANIIKFDFDKYPDVGDSEHDTNYWIAVKEEFIQKYGSDEHEASAKIMAEIGTSPRSIEIVNGAHWPHLLENGSFNGANILIYADMRVNPHSVTELEARINELIERDQAKGRPIDFYEKLKPAALKLEQEIAQSVDLSYISNEAVNDLSSKLLRTEI